MTGRPSPECIILYRISDLLVRSRIEHFASQSHISIVTIQDYDALVATLKKTEQAAVICDLVVIEDEIESVAGILTDKKVLLIGFYPHVNAMLRERAKSSGFSDVVPRSALEMSLKRLFGSDCLQ